jgi:hypothetical protein
MKLVDCRRVVGILLSHSSESRIRADVAGSESSLPRTDVKPLSGER